MASARGSSKEVGDKVSTAVVAGGGWSEAGGSEYMYGMSSFQKKKKKRSGTSGTTTLQTDPHKFDPLLIEDPLLPTNNIGRNCFRFAYVQRECANAHSKLLASLKISSSAAATAEEEEEEEEEEDSFRKNQEIQEDQKKEDLEKEDQEKEDQVEIQEKEDHQQEQEKAANFLTPRTTETKNKKKRSTMHILGSILSLVVEIQSNETNVFNMRNSDGSIVASKLTLSHVRHHHVTTPSPQHRPMTYSSSGGGGRLGWSDSSNSQFSSSSPLR